MQIAAITVAAGLSVTSNFGHCGLVHGSTQHFHSTTSSASEELCRHFDAD
jgi:hypothetical protein